MLILQPGGNDARRGISDSQRQANIAEIQRRMRDRNVPVIVLHPFGAGLSHIAWPTGSISAPKHMPLWPRAWFRKSWPPRNVKR